MKKTVASVLLLAIPSLSFAADYTGFVSAINLNQQGNELLFEVADQEKADCTSSWFKIAKPANNGNGLSMSDVIVRSYFNKNPVAVTAESVCNAGNNPVTITNIALGNPLTPVQPETPGDAAKAQE